MKRIVIAAATILAPVPLAIYGYGEVRERFITVKPKTDYTVQAVVGTSKEVSKEKSCASPKEP